VDDRKGIVGSVKLNGQELKGWEMFPLPLENLHKLKFKTGRVQTGPAFYRAHFDLKPMGDTFFDLRGWGKGYVWVNGHNLGRYWGVGPQQSLYCPGGLAEDRGQRDRRAGSGRQRRTDVAGTREPGVGDAW
jgi:beta-galactosidase